MAGFPAVGVCCDMAVLAVSAQGVAVSQDIRVTEAVEARFAVFGKVLEAPASQLAEVVQAEARDNPAILVRTPREKDRPEPPPTNHDAKFDGIEGDLARLCAEGRGAFGHRRSREATLEEAERQQKLLTNKVARGSLYDYLLRQLSDICDGEEPVVLEFAEFLVSRVNSKGYLPEDTEALAAAFNCQQSNARNGLGFVSPDQAARARRRLQGLEPAGVVAQNLRERLLVQLRYLPIPHPRIADPALLNEMVEDHFDDFAHNRLDKLARRTGVSVMALKTAREDLKYLDPNPCRNFASETLAIAVKPDVFVEQNGDGKFVVRLNRREAPVVGIAASYRRVLKDPNADSEAVQFVLKKISQARQLVEAIERRYQTLQEIAEAIVAYQTGFLLHGPLSLRAITQEELARRLGKHPATVSRAVSNKWIQVPCGLFAMQAFFASEDDVRAARIQQCLRQLIDAEDKTAPLTDRQVQDRLATIDGYRTARTTIVKYRRELGIPEVALRKHFDSHPT